MDASRTATLMRQLTNLRLVILNVLAVFVGTFVLRVVSTPQSFPTMLATAVGSALIASGVIGLSLELLLHRSVAREVRESLALDREIVEWGIVGLGDRWPRDDWVTSAFRNATHVNVVCHWDEVWTMGGLWREEFHRAHSRGVTFDVLLPDPGNERLMRQLSQKAALGGAAVVDIGVRVAALAAAFSNIESPATFRPSSKRRRQVELRVVDFPQPYTCYRFGNVGVMRALPAHNQGIACPILLLQNEGKLWNFVSEDFDRTWRLLSSPPEDSATT